MGLFFLLLTAKELVVYTFWMSLSMSPASQEMKSSQRQRDSSNTLKTLFSIPVRSTCSCQKSLPNPVGSSCHGSKNAIRITVVLCISMKFLLWHFLLWSVLLLTRQSCRAVTFLIHLSNFHEWVTFFITRLTQRATCSSRRDIALVYNAFCFVIDRSVPAEAVKISDAC